MTSDMGIKEERIFIFEDEDEKRCDLFLAMRNEDLTRSKIQKFISEGLLLINGKISKGSFKLKKGDILRLKVPAETKLELLPEKVEFSIIYEDEALVVINKPAGLVVHPAHGNFTGTLVHGLLFRYPEFLDKASDSRPGIVHRLDKDTSGVMVVCKNDVVKEKIRKQFEGRIVEKEYIALVTGVLKEANGVIDRNIIRDEKARKKFRVSADFGRNAVTKYRVLKTYMNIASLVAIKPLTGRTHQIRVHLSSIGHPVIGDELYGNNRILNWKFKQKRFPKVSRQLLHARKIGFIHPVSGEKSVFSAPLPPDFIEIVRQLHRLELEFANSV